MRTLLLVTAALATAAPALAQQQRPSQFMAKYGWHASRAVLDRLPALRSEPAPAPQPPLYIEKVSARHNVRSCVHCHQAKELLRIEAAEAKTWDPESRWVFPLPENIGLTLERDRGD